VEEMTTEQKQAIALASARLRLQPESTSSISDAIPGYGVNPQSPQGQAMLSSVKNQALDVGMGFGPASIAASVGKAAAPALTSTAEWLMGTAIKPTLSQRKSGEAARAIDTMLDQGLNATKGGIETLKSKIRELNDSISETIANSDAMVKVGNVGKSLLDTLNRFANQVTPQTDLATIRNAWGMFRTNPLIAGAEDIPVQLAQKLKVGTYRQLAGKYGELSSAEIESQKALARGLKDEIASSVPGISELNLKDSELLNALNVTERRALMDLNNNPGGLSWLTHRPAAFAAYMADKSALFKSLMARVINAGAEKIPETALGIAGGAAGVNALPNQPPMQQQQPAQAQLRPQMPVNIGGSMGTGNEDLAQRQAQFGDEQAIQMLLQSRLPRIAR